jgi:hypothetical protein
MIETVDPSTVKNPAILTGLTDYLNRVRNYIPCYAIRAELGLLNSSNLGEKTNDLVVADRQKHNGMSWSKEGSSGLASICRAYVNGEIRSWTHKKVLQFRPIPCESPDEKQVA